MKTQKHYFLTIVFCILALGIPYQIQAQDYEMSMTKTADDMTLTWNKAPDFFPGCTFTILHGDLTKPNLDFFFKIEPDTEVVEHTHNSSERMILISGELEVQYQGEKSQIIKPGTYAYGPPKKPHRAKCLKGDPCVLFIAMVEPFSAEPTGIAMKD